MSQERVLVPVPEVRPHVCGPALAPRSRRDFPRCSRPHDVTVHPN